MNAVTPTAGHNEPPLVIPADELQTRLEAKHGAIMRRANELLKSATRVPAVIQDEETSGRLADFVKQITDCAKVAEATREAEKAPFLEGGRAVDGFFKTRITDALEKLKKDMTGRQKAWQLAVAAEEQKRREAEAQAAAAEAARIRREAEAAMAKAAEEERVRQEAIRAQAAEADRIRREAEEAERRRLAAEKAAADAKDAEARQKAQAEAAAAEAERRAREAEAAEAARQQAAAEATARQQAEAEERRRIEAEAATTEAANQAAVAADVADNTRVKDITRTRGGYGAMSSLRDHWTFRDVEVGALDLETLRPFFAGDSIEKAIKAYIRSGGRELKGCVIFNDPQSVTR